VTLPFVSRRAYDLVSALLRDAERRHADALAQLRADLVASESRCREVTDTLCRMKLAGAEPIQLHRGDLPPPAPDPIKQAIVEQCRIGGNSPGLMAQLRHHAWALKQEGKTTDQIVTALGKWESSEDFSAPRDSLVPVEDVA